MPKLVTTITKHQDTDPWVLLARPYRAQIFSQEQINGPIKDYFDLVNTMTGLVPDGLVETVSGNVYKTVREFQTVEDIQKYQTAMGDITNPVIAAKNDVIRQKMQELGIQPYTVTFEVQQ